MSDTQTLIHCMLPLLIQVFDLYGVGLRQGCSTPNLVKELDFKVDKLSTGDSLDITPQDEASIVANDAVIKDIVSSNIRTDIRLRIRTFGYPNFGFG
ncbi:hypothetical protein R6Q59_010368 [Mikania micrantha]